ncbi:hypothetical protein [Roseibium sp. Sym1]|uniref:hypothetical protein n=1 Tax=Roseibium sp. Sym1 TaxID=3016006 RepID=UPI0022B3C66F|nr:hypothetical protein [Roseibium sp. Sym1]
MGFARRRTEDGKGPRGPKTIDKDSKESVALRVGRKLNAGNVVNAVSDLFISRGIPSF